MAKNTGSNVEYCMKALTPLLVDFQRQGIMSTAIVAALAEAAIQAAQAEKAHAQMHLDALPRSRKPPRR